MYLVYVRPSSRRVKICSIPFFRKCHLQSIREEREGAKIRCIKIVTPREILSLRRHDEGMLLIIQERKPLICLERGGMAFS